jgi:hypothetical protein
MTSLQEYDLELNPTKIIKGKGLFKLVTQDMDDENKEEYGWQEEPTMYTQHVPYIPIVEDSYYNDLKCYLQHCTISEHLNSKHKRALKLKSLQYMLVCGILFRKNYDGVLLRCLEK